MQVRVGRGVRRTPVSQAVAVAQVVHVAARTALLERSHTHSSYRESARTTGRRARRVATRKVARVRPTRRRLVCPKHHHQQHLLPGQARAHQDTTHKHAKRSRRPCQRALKASLLACPKAALAVMQQALRMCALVAARAQVAARAFTLPARSGQATERRRVKLPRLSRTRCIPKSAALLPARAIPASGRQARGVVISRMHICRWKAS